MLEEKNKVQVKEGHYKKKRYNTFERFISYFFQIDSVISLPEVETVLEIGPGSKILSRELTALGYKVTTCDFDKNVLPDVVSDVRSLPFEKDSFDCIVACQILEHIPYGDFEKVLGDFHRISRKYVVISLPEKHTGLNIVLKFPFIQTLLKRKYIDLSLRFPVRFGGFEDSGQHYFEIDYFTTSKKKVRNSLKEHFKILREFNPPLNKFHHFFILEKK